MSIINSFQSFSFMASLGAMTGGEIPSSFAVGGKMDSPSPLAVEGNIDSPSPLEPVLSVVEGGEGWGGGAPLFRPRTNRHKIVPVELLPAKPVAPFEEGARVFLEPPSLSQERRSDFPLPPRGGGPGWGEDPAEEEGRMAAGGWFRRLFRPSDPVGEFFAEVERKLQGRDSHYFETSEFTEKVGTLTNTQRLALALRIEARLGDAYGGVRWAAVEALKSITPHLVEGDRLTLALAIEAWLGCEPWLVLLAAVSVLEPILPHLADPDRRRLEGLKEGEGASVGALSRIFKQLTDYNRVKMMRLFEPALEAFSFQAWELPTTLQLWADIFERWPRLGFPVVEGLVEGVKKGIVSKAPEVKEREDILRFIGVTHGFVPAVYAAYRRGGEKVLAEIRNYGTKILSEEMGIEDLNAIAKAHEADGGMEFVLAVIQTVSPTSGASFVKRGQQVGLLENMLEAGDRRKDIPESWRGVVKTFELEQGSWRLKVGEVADPEGKILSLLGQFRAGEGEKVDEAKALDGLEKYLQSERREEDLERVRAVLFAFAGSQDALREKIDRIQDNDYVALDLLDQLFRDKDNLAVLIRDLLNKVSPALLVDKGGEGKKKTLAENTDRLVKELRKQWNNPKIGESDRVRVVANMLSGYTPESIQSKLLSREDVRGTALGEAIEAALREAPALGKGKIIETILSGPLKQIEAEKRKFAYQAGEPTQIALRAVKGPAFGMYGLTAGVCTGTDIDLWKKPMFKLLAITDENDRQVVGYIHLFESKDDTGRRILTLPGINPSTEFMATVDSAALYAKVMAQVIAFAELDGYHGVYIPTDPGIHSNRTGIQKAIQKAGHPVVKIPEVLWNTLPQPYPFSEVYVVWKGAKE